MAAPAALVNDWTHEGGSVKEFDQGSKLDSEVMAPGRDVSGGVCMCTCKIWARTRLNGRHGDGLFTSVTTGSSWQMAKGLQGSEDPTTYVYDVTGLDRTQKDRRRGLFNRQLTSRDSILNEIFAKRGVYLLNSRDKSDISGHVISFDTTPPDLYFYDPNGGQFWFKHVDTSKDAFFRRWFKDYWDQMDYKVDFHKGRRELHKYTLNAG